MSLRCLKTLILTALALSGALFCPSAALAKPGEVYTEPPAGVLAYAPFLIRDGEVCLIIDYTERYPIIVEEGEEQVIRRDDRYVFLPVAGFAPVHVVNDKPIKEVISGNFDTTRRHVTLDRDVDKLYCLGLCTAEYDETNTQITGRREGPFVAYEPRECFVRIGSLVRNFNDQGVYFDIFYCMKGKPLFQAFTPNTTKIFEHSEQQFFGSIRQQYLAAHPHNTTELQLLHHPLPETPDESLKGQKLVFQTRFDEEGRVDRVIPQDGDAPTPLIDAGVQALFAWRSLPALEDGLPVASEVLIPIQF
ncbi:MAG: hypothetical protein E1N59_2756 [Puniceicoccaceae bacterium 5H]|nr:MAG: hypothetical protein E1N59_2756 [Puniceicoccaceae bacterium 5H]